MNRPPTQTMREIREVVREEPLMHRPILRALARGPRTVPEIAEAISRPTEETLVWIMGLRRYGKVVELKDPTDDGYFRYSAVDTEARA